MRKEQKFNKNVDAFLNQMKDKNKSDNTIQNYRYDLDKFQKYAVDHDVDLGMINFSKQDFINYINYLKEQGFAPKTIKRNADALNVFIHFLYNKEELKRLPFVNAKEMKEYLPKIQKKKVRVLSREELESIMKTASATGIFEESLIRVLYSSATRISEALNIKWDDIREEDGKYILSIEEGKGDKYREVLLSPKTVDCIYKMKEQRDWNSEYVFELKSTRKPISRRYATTLVSDTIEKSNVKNASSHVFRRTMATMLLEKGVDVAYVSKFLGHADISTTYNSYVSVERELFNKVEEAFEEI